MPNNIRIKQLNQEELSGFFNSVITSDLYVNRTGEQLISGIKTFATRPYFNNQQILAQGDLITGVVSETGEKENLNVYISLNGSDSNAELGNVFRPYRTAQNAFSGLYFSNRTGCLIFGVGSFEEINLDKIGATSWPTRISIKGAGNQISYLEKIFSSGYDLNIYSDKTIDLGSILAYGKSKLNTNGNPTFAGNINLSNCKIKNITGIGGSYIDETNSYTYFSAPGPNLNIFDSEVNRIFTSGGFNSINITTGIDSGAFGGNIIINNSIINHDVISIGGSVKTGSAGFGGNITAYNSRIYSILSRGGNGESDFSRVLGVGGNIDLNTVYCEKSIITSGGNSLNGIGGNAGSVNIKLSTIQSGIFANGGFGGYSNGTGGFVNLILTNSANDIYAVGGIYATGGSINLYNCKVNNINNSGYGAVANVAVFNSTVNLINNQ